MGRRPLGAERRPQIIAAVIECMAVHGVNGTTLEGIARTAGMTRGHVRHFAGNRDELLTDAARVFFFGDAALDEKDATKASQRYPILDPSLNLAEAIDYLFGEFAEPNSDNAAAFAFIDAGRTMAPIHDILLSAYIGMLTSLVRITRTEYPNADEAACHRVSYGLLAIAMGNVTITDIEASDTRTRDARAAAIALIGTLER